MIRVQLDRSKDKGFIIRVISSNGKELFRTSETYKRRKGAEKAWDALEKAFDETGYRWEDLTRK